MLQERIISHATPLIHTTLSSSLSLPLSQQSTVDGLTTRLADEVKLAAEVAAARAQTAELADTRRVLAETEAALKARDAVAAMPDRERILAARVLAAQAENEALREDVAVATRALAAEQARRAELEQVVESCARDAEAREIEAASLRAMLADAEAQLAAAKGLIVHGHGLGPTAAAEAAARRVANAVRVKTVDHASHTVGGTDCRRGSFPADYDAHGQLRTPYRARARQVSAAHDEWAADGAAQGALMGAATAGATAASGAAADSRAAGKGAAVPPLPLVRVGVGAAAGATLTAGVAAGVNVTAHRGVGGSQQQKQRSGVTVITGPSESEQVLGSARAPLTISARGNEANAGAHSSIGNSGPVKRAATVGSTGSRSGAAVGSRPATATASVDKATVGGLARDAVKARVLESAGTKAARAVANGKAAYARPQAYAAARGRNITIGVGGGV